MTQKFEHSFLDKKSTASQTYKEVVKMQEQGWEMAAVDTQVIWMKRSITPVEADQKESYIKAIEIQNAENPLAEIDKKFEEGSQKELEKSLRWETRIKESNEREIKEAEEYRNSIKNFVEQINIWGKEKWKFNNRIGFSESTSAEEVAATMLFAVYKMIREKKLAKWSAISKILEEKIHNFLDEE